MSMLLSRNVPAMGRSQARPQPSTRLWSQQGNRKIGMKSTSAAALPVYTLAAGLGIEKALQPAVDASLALDLPEAIVRWGHPGNMAVVLLAMGGYGAAYLGWAIRTSDDADLIIKAKQLHPKLAAGMTFFFSAGAVGGMVSLLMQGKPIWQSGHVWTGLIGLLCLYLQGMLSLFFEDDPNARSVHAYFGSAIMALFVVHATLGIKLGLSL